MEDLVRHTQKVIMLTLPGNPGDNVYNKTMNAIHHTTMEAADLIVVSWHTHPDTFYVLKHRHRVVSSTIGWCRSDMNLMLKDYYEQVVESKKTYDKIMNIIEEPVNLGF